MEVEAGVDGEKEVCGGGGDTKMVTWAAYHHDALYAGVKLPKKKKK